MSESGYSNCRLGIIGLLFPAAIARSTSSSFLFFSFISLISARRAV